MVKVAKIRIEVVKDAKLWDDAVKKSKGTIFHRWSWLRCVKDQTKTKLYPLMAYIRDEPLCILPLFIRKKGIDFIFSPPPKALLVYMGVAFVKEYSNLRKFESVFNDFLMSLNEFIKSEFGSCYICIRNSPYLQDIRPFKWAGYSVIPYYTLSIDLRNSLERIWNSFDKKVRNNIRKTEREGCIVEHGGWYELDALRRMLAERFIAQGFKPTKDYYKDYLYALFEEFYPEHMKVFASKIDGNVIGGFVGLTFNNRFLLWIGIPRVDLKGVYPNDLAIWEGIKWAKENGYRYFEILDAGDDARLSRYKSQFNPNPEIWFTSIKLTGILKILEFPFKKILR